MSFTPCSGKEELFRDVKTFSLKKPTFEK